jgi:polysaccharide biosynthesis transport protein
MRHTGWATWASSGFAEAYRNIRSALLLNPSGKPFKILTVTSTVPKEGKTTTSANLATSFAQTGHKVLLVDVDLHRGGLHRFFGLQAGRGLTEILTGQMTLDQVVQHAMRWAGHGFDRHGRVPRQSRPNWCSGANEGVPGNWHRKNTIW